MIDRNPAFYAVIPAPVRYDKELSANAKLLYGEITSLAVAKGYCWAENRYFAELYGLSIRTIKNIIKQLEQRGYIATEVLRNESTNEVEQRRIYIKRPMIEDAPLVQKTAPPSCRNLHDPGAENCTDIYVINTRDNNPPIVPPEGDGAPVEKNKRKIKTTPPEVLGVLRRYAGEDEELSRALMGFAENRQKIKKPIATVYTAELLLKSLDKLSGGGRAVKIALLEKATLKNWLTIYELKPDELPAPEPEDSGEEDPWDAVC